MPTFTTPILPANASIPTFDNDLEWTRRLFQQLESEYPGMTPAEILQAQPPEPQSRLRQHMPKKELPPIFPTEPLNLNTDGSEITYEKSRAGPNANYRTNAGAEKIKRLFVNEHYTATVS